MLSLPRRLLHRMRVPLAAGSTTSDLLSIFSATDDVHAIPETKAAQTQKSKCRLASTDPVQHGANDVNTFHVVDVKDEALVKDVLLTERRRTEVSQQGFCSFLLRGQTLKVAEVLDAHESKEKMPQVYLTGRDGHGKSTALAYLAYRYWKKGWVILPVQSGAEWVLQPNYIDASTSRPGRVDSTKNSIEWLNHFFKLNSDRVPQLSTTRPYTWLEGAYTSPVGTPIKELLSLIDEDDRSSTDIVGVLLKELLAMKDRPNCLLAVDDMNGLFEPSTPLVDENLQPVCPENISLVHAFRKIYRNHKKFDRVGIVSATSTYNGVLSALNDETRELLASSARLHPIEPAVSFSEPSDLQSMETLQPTNDSNKFKIKYGVATGAEVAAFLEYHNSIGWCNMPYNSKSAKIFQALSAGKLSLLANQINSA